MTMTNFNTFLIVTSEPNFTKNQGPWGVETQKTGHLDRITQARTVANR